MSNNWKSFTLRKFIFGPQTRTWVQVPQQSALLRHPWTWAVDKREWLLTSFMVHKLSSLALDYFKGVLPLQRFQGNRENHQIPSSIICMLVRQVHPTKSLQERPSTQHASAMHRNSYTHYPSPFTVSTHCN